MKKFSNNPLKAANFDRTFSRWGTFDRRNKASNVWHNPEIPLPPGCDYKTLTDDLHPDQEAYRRWVLDIMAYLIFHMALESPVVRLLEVACADAREVHLFLEKFAHLWQKSSTSLEIHLLDDDEARLSEAAQDLNGHTSRQIKLFLWQGKLEELNMDNFLLHNCYPAGMDGPVAIFPLDFHMIFSQLALHHYPLFQLVDIFKSIYKRLMCSGCFILSDIFYTGIPLYDALTWNRVLLQIENLPGTPQKKFWLDHYLADYPTYQKRKDIIAALELIGFEDVETLQCAYDMATIAAIKP